MRPGRLAMQGVVLRLARGVPKLSTVTRKRKS